MESIKPQSLTADLLEMCRIDQAMRDAAAKDASLWDDSVDAQNTACLKEIVAKNGWPTTSTVGAEASHAAWLLVQHAYADPDFMKTCLALMKKANDQHEGEVTQRDIAYLEDRLLTMENEPQIYGTQFHIVNGALEPFPIKDPEHIDERRARVGLDTFAEYKVRVQAMYS